MPKVLYFLVHKYVQVSNYGVKLTREFQPQFWFLSCESRGPYYHLDGPTMTRKQRRISSMRLLEKMCFVVLASGLAMGQATATNSGSAGTGSVADELKALREAISQQQKQISDQQKQMSQQQQQIQTLQQQLQDKTSGTPHVADASLHMASPAPATTIVQETEKPKESPLSFRIGGTD